MKILFCSVPFRPSVGGIETVSALLAEQFHAQGHPVTLVTQTFQARDGTAVADPEPYAIVRQPRALQLWALVREADVVFHNNISLRLAWPLLLLRRPWVVAHHTWIPQQGAGRIKRWLLRWATNISVSRAVAQGLPQTSMLLPNPYRTALFRRLPGFGRDGDIAFVGRLVTDKGVGLLIDALHRMSAGGARPRLTLVGAGPEAAALAAQVRRLGLQDQVCFAGQMGGEALVRLLNEHRVLAVPSLWEEPFGLVALEALACGCVPVVAHSGGLPEAVGPCGRVVPKGDVQAWADALGALLADPDARQALLARAPEHLARHRPETVSLAYLKVFEDACRPSPSALAA
jgi:glycosyltransferase involved in cell wall biosynthesis